MALVYAMTHLLVAFVNLVLALTCLGLIVLKVCYSDDIACASSLYCLQSVLASMGYVMRVPLAQASAYQDHVMLVLLETTVTLVCPTVAF